jgi:hypothetical protein
MEITKIKFQTCNMQNKVEEVYETLITQKESMIVTQRQEVLVWNEAE